MEQSFHLFPKFPKEIRDLIWDFAIRPPVPSAHFFVVSRKRALVAQDAVLARWHRNLKPCLGRPTLFVQHWFGDPKENPSAYMVDCDLWVTCRESREAMARRFETSRWRDHFALYALSRKQGQATWEVPQTPRPLSRLLDEDFSVTASFDLNYTRHYITFLPKTDLICLRDRPGSDGPSIRGVNTYRLANVAVEINSDHAQPFRHRGVSQEAVPHVIAWLLCDTAVGPGDVKTVWLINYRLRRTSPQSSLGMEMDKGRQVFYAAEFRFVEVFGEDDPCWTWVPEGHEPPDTTDSIYTKIVTWLDYGSWEYGYSRTWTRTGMYTFQSDDGVETPPVKLLACERLSGHGSGPRDSEQD